MQFKRVEAVCNERIAKALEGIHHELKRLNDSNPSNQAQAKQKEPEKKEFKPKKFHLRWYLCQSVKQLVLALPRQYLVSRIR